MKIIQNEYSLNRFFMLPSPNAKLGRNDPCHCGSGKKYKKCCINAAAVPYPLPSEDTPDSYDSAPDLSNESLVHTATGEPFMPARLYYLVTDKQKLIKALLALKCVSRYDEDSFSHILLV